MAEFITLSKLADRYPMYSFKWTVTANANGTREMFTWVHLRTGQKQTLEGWQLQPALDCVNLVLKQYQLPG